MRTDEELREAIAIVGASFTSTPLREFVWGGAPGSALEAWAAFQALGWAVGANDSGFAATLAFVTLKLQQYAELEENHHHAQ